jgi:hypothetical protein
MTDCFYLYLALSQVHGPCARKRTDARLGCAVGTYGGRAGHRNGGVSDLIGSAAIVLISASNAFAMSCIRALKPTSRTIWESSRRECILCSFTHGVLSHLESPRKDFIFARAPRGRRRGSGYDRAKWKKSRLGSAVFQACRSIRGNAPALY